MNLRHVSSCTHYVSIINRSICALIQILTAQSSMSPFCQCLSIGQIVLTEHLIHHLV